MRRLTAISFAKDYINNPNAPGSLRAHKALFGDCSRYAVAPVNTRFEEVEWFVWDADIIDSDGKPDVIRQAPTLIEAIKGLIKVEGLNA